jgi:hypothetical protein
MIIEIFKCKNCSRDFDSSQRTPILIPCGHSICKKCLESSCRNNGFVKCGSDFKKFFFNAENYKINETAIEFFNEISKIKDSDKVMKYHYLA